MVTFPTFFELSEIFTSETAALMFLQSRDILCAPVCSACNYDAIEGTWAGVKQKIPVRNRTLGIEGNLWEFIWRRRNKNDLWGGFVEALKEVIYE